MTDFPLLKKIGLNRKHSTRSYRLQGNNGKAAAFSQLHGASGPSLRWWWKLDPDRLDADSQMVSENFLGAPSQTGIVQLVRMASLILPKVLRAEFQFCWWNQPHICQDFPEMVLEFTKWRAKKYCIFLENHPLAI